MNTIMAGLACGEPCAEAWELLNQFADYYIAVPDSFAASGMTHLAHPKGNDPVIVSGESGAAGVGTLIELLSSPAEDPLAEEDILLFAAEDLIPKYTVELGLFPTLIRELKLSCDSRVLCISTEGATDRLNYEHITGLSPEKVIRK